MTKLLIALNIVLILYLILAIVLNAMTQRRNREMLAHLISSAELMVGKANLALGKYNREMAWRESLRQVRRNDEDVARYECINAEYKRRLDEENDASRAHTGAR